MSKKMMKILYFLLGVLFLIALSIYIERNSSSIDFIILISCVGVIGTLAGLLYSVINYNKSKKQLDKHSTDLSEQITFLKEINETNKKEILSTIANQIDGANRLQSKSISIEDYLSQYMLPHYKSHIAHTSTLFREDLSLERNPENGLFLIEPESFRRKYSDILEPRPSTGVFKVEEKA